MHRKAALLLPLAILATQAPAAAATTATKLTTSSATGITELLSLKGWCSSNGKLYFRAHTPAAGGELWATDGKTASLVADIVPGAGSSDPYGCLSTSYGAIFATQPGGPARPVYRTNGTAAGTVLVTPALEYASSGGVVIGTRTYFMAKSTAGNPNLWMTDAAGTSEIPTTGAASGLANTVGPMRVGGDVIYWDTGKLYKHTPGQAAGALVKTLTSTVPRFSRFSSPAGPGYFTVSDGSVWKTDGTMAGTVAVKTGLGAITSPPIVAGSKTYFCAYEPASGPPTLLWVTDGTTTSKVFTAGPTPDCALAAPLGERIVFPGYTTADGEELWVSDGTMAGTTKLKDFGTGTASAKLHTLIASKDRVFFVATETGQGEQPWVTDGTSAGTTRLATLAPGLAGRVVNIHVLDELTQLAFVHTEATTPYTFDLYGLVTTAPPGSADAGPTPPKDGGGGSGGDASVGADAGAGEDAGEQPGGNAATGEDAGSDGCSMTRPSHGTTSLAWVWALGAIALRRFRRRDPQGPQPPRQ